MNNTEKFIYHACAYTVGVSIVFFIFARLMKIVELSISFLRYFTIFAFSLVLSGSEFLFTIEKLPKYLRHILHYLILCIAFFVVFLTVQKSSGEYQFRVDTVFAAIFIFSAFYVIATLIYLFVAKSSKKTAKDAKAQEKTSNAYKPKFK